uniref:Cleavage/polyadenylation specificity factor A subunit N-terminal domain-containing protein n=1 Tax=Davidia involucrata TaxID=16924 RepID=A0A5B6YYX8_DAVIN
MVVVQAAKLKLPQSSSLSSPKVSSLLFDPHSLSLALMHSDSSFSLYPSLSPFSLSSPSPSSLSPPQTFIPSPSSSAIFLRLQNPNPNSTPRVLFIVAAPHHGGGAVLLRFWILRKSQSFARAQVLCNQTGLRFDDNKLGVIFNVNHGVSIKLVGSINVFAMYSISNCKIWVFSAKMAGDEDDGVTVKLMKCAVIDCCMPVFSISISFGFLILGEENGVRVFPLRPLVKGRVRKHWREKKTLNGGLKNDKLKGQRLKLPNGDDLFSDSMIHSYYGVSGHGGSESTGGEGTGESSSNGYLEGKIDKHSDRVKLRPVKLRQDSKEGGACFVAFKSKNFESFKSTKVPLKSEKAISIEALSPNKFLVLDSVGDLHLLCLSNPVLGSEIPCQVKQLTHTMKVQKMAVLPDTSMRTQTVWLSDGHHTVHMMAVSDMDTFGTENDRNDSEETLMQISVIEAIFASEKIQDIISLAANSILILGQGSIFAYAIS